MFNLTIDGKNAVVSQGRNYLLQRYNPMLDFDTVRGAKMLDFVLPFCDQNNKIFSNFGHPQVKYNFKKYYTELSLYGRIIERGYVQLRNVSRDGFVVFYTQNLGEIFGDYQKTALNLLPFGSEVIPGSLPANPSHLTAKYCFPKVENSAFYGTNGGSIGYSGFVNNYVSGAYSSGPKVPMMFLRYVLERIGEICNVKFKGSFLTDARTSRLILYNTFSLDGAANITYANHLPELTIPDLLKELRKMFNLAMFFDTSKREIRLEFVDVMLGQAVVKDWSSKFPRLENKTPVLDNRIAFSCELDSNDALMQPLPGMFGNYISAIGTDGEQLFDIPTKISSLLMNGSWPIAQQVGVSNQFNQGNNKFAPRLLFWEGLVSGVPKATNSYSGTTLSTASLVSNFYAKYEKFRRNTQLTSTPATLSAADISVIDSHRKGPEAVFAIHAQGNNYLIGNQQIQLPNNKIVLELWKM